MPEITVRPAEPADEPAVVGVITLAFSADPMARWVQPDAGRYVATMPDATRAFGGRAFESQSAYVDDACRGAALWLAPGVEPDVERLIALFEANVPGDRLPDLLQIFEQMEHYHPAEPHWYLPVIGVDPACQGSGCGSALMRHACDLFDRDHVWAYLESSNPRNISLYERHGFERLGTIQVGSSPPIVPMSRRPRARD